MNDDDTLEELRELDDYGIDNVDSNDDEHEHDGVIDDDEEDVSTMLCQS